MSDASFYSTGSWQPLAGQEEPFLEAWTEFSSWAAGQPGAAGAAVMVRDLRDPERFVSFMPWESLDAIQGVEGARRVQAADVAACRRSSTSSHRPRPKSSHARDRTA